MTALRHERLKRASLFGTTSATSGLKTPKNRKTALHLLGMHAATNSELGKSKTKQQQTLSGFAVNHLFHWTTAFDGGSGVEGYIYFQEVFANLLGFFLTSGYLSNTLISKSSSSSTVLQLNVIFST